MTTLEPPPTSSEASARPGSLLVATGIEKSFRRGWWPRRRHLPVLRGADLDLGAGEVVGLVGENGSGKSTLMRILVGRWPPMRAPSPAPGASDTARRSLRCTGD